MQFLPSHLFNSSVERGLETAGVSFVCVNTSVCVCRCVCIGVCVSNVLRSIVCKCVCRCVGARVTTISYP